MKKASSLNLITRTMRMAWLNDGTTPEEEDAYQDYGRKIMNAGPCACGSGEPAQYPTLPGEDGICIVCYWDREAHMKEQV